MPSKPPLRPLQFALISASCVLAYFPNAVSFLRTRTAQPKLQGPKVSLSLLLLLLLLLLYYYYYYYDDDDDDDDGYDD